MNINEIRKLDKKSFLQAFNNTINDELRLLKEQVSKVSEEFNKFFSLLIDKMFKEK